MNGSIKSKLELIREAANDVKARIDGVLEKNDRIGIATMNTGPYKEDLYRLMREMAEVANPVLSQMGLDKGAITGDIEEFVKILDDNEQVLYFASINIDAKYSRNRYALVNLHNWLERLDKSIGKVMAFIDSQGNADELDKIFKIIDGSKLSKKEKEGLKEEFSQVVNRIKNCP